MASPPLIFADGNLRIDRASTLVVDAALAKNLPFKKRIGN
jgi:hypothetical protein